MQGERENMPQVMYAVTFFAHQPDSKVTERLEVTVWLDVLLPSDQRLSDTTPPYTQGSRLNRKRMYHLIISWSWA